MKIKEGFILREVAGSYVVVAVGSASLKFKGVIKLNESGAFLWKAIEKGADTVEKLTTEMLKEYNVEENIAKEDVLAFVNQLKGANIIE